MINLKLIEYVGLISGIVGSVTGVAGAILGYIAYRKSNSIKTLDLRIELKKAINCLEHSLSHIRCQIEKADQSRLRIFAMNGQSMSGRQKIWAQEVEVDKQVVEQVASGVLAAYKNNNELNLCELEAGLVEFHRNQIQVDELIKKYAEAIYSDEEIRKAVAARYRS